MRDRTARALLVAAVGLHLVDALVTARAWSLETNPLVRGLGLEAWLGLKLGLLVGLVAAWRWAREHRHGRVALLGPVAVGLIALANLSRLGWGATGRFATGAVVCVVAIAAGVYAKDQVAHAARRLAAGVTLQRVGTAVVVWCLIVSTVMIPIPNSNVSPVESADAASVSSVSELAFQANGFYVRALDKSTGDQVWEYENNSYSADWLAYNDENNLLYVTSGSYDHIIVLDPMDGSEVRVFRADLTTYAITAHPSGGVVVAGANNEAAYYDSTGAEQWTYTGASGGQFRSALTANNTIYLGDKDYSLSRLDLQGNLIDENVKSGSYLDDLTYIPPEDGENGKIAATRYNDISVFDAVTLTELDTRQDLSSETLSITSGGGRLFVGLKNGDVTILNESTLSTVGSTDFSASGEVLGLDTDNESGFYASASNGGSGAWRFDSTGASDWENSSLVGYDIIAVDAGGGTSQSFNLTGQVTNTDGDPVSGATVSTNTSKSTTTNATGYYSLSLANGTYALNATADGYLATNTTVSVSGNTTKDLTLQPKTYTVSGTVEYANGTLVEGATAIAIRGDPLPVLRTGSDTTDASGAYAAALNGSGDYIVAAKKGRRVAASSEFTVADQENVTGVLVTLPADPTDQDPDDTDGDGIPDSEDPDDDGDGIPDDEDPDDDGDGIPDDREVRVTGIVENESGTALQGAAVTVTNTDRSLTRTNTTSATGSYLVYTGEGNLTVEAGAGGYVNETTTIQNATTDQSVDFQLEAAGANAPSLDSASASPRGQIPDEPIDFQIDVTDRDFSQEGDNVTVTFYLDGTQIGTDTLTANGTATTTHHPINGSASWYAEATDDAGNTVRSQTFSLSGPGLLRLFNESAPNTKIATSPVEITVSNEEDVQNLTLQSDAVLNLSRVDLDGDMTAVIDAPEYRRRAFWLPSRYTNDRVYLLPGPARSTSNYTVPRTANITFRLEDRTGRFPARETALLVDRPLNVSGQARYETVASDTFDAAGEYVPELEDNVRYRLRVTNGNETRTLHHYTTAGDDVATLPISQVSLRGEIPSGRTLQAKLLTDSDGDQFVRLIYLDSNADSYALLYEVTNETSGQTVLANQTALSPGELYVADIPVTFNDSQAVTYRVDWHASAPFDPATDAVGGRERVGSVRDIDDRLTDVLDAGILSLAAQVLMIAGGGLAAIVSGPLGALVATLLGSAFTLSGILNIPGAALGLMGAVTVAALTGRAAG